MLRNLFKVLDMRIRPWICRRAGGRRSGLRLALLVGTRPGPQARGAAVDGRMMERGKSRPLGLGRKWLAGSEGVTAVEFAIVLIAFALLALGTVEFGYDWFVKNAITNAARDGARYGVMYRWDNTAGIRIAANQLPYTANNNNFTQTIQNVVDNELTGVLPLKADGTNSWTAVPSGTGYAGQTPGLPLTVTVTFHRQWSALEGLLPSVSLANWQTITVTSTMNIE